MAPCRFRSRTPAVLPRRLRVPTDGRRLGPPVRADLVSGTDSDTDVRYCARRLRRERFAPCPRFGREPPREDTRSGFRHDRVAPLAISRFSRSGPCRLSRATRQAHPPEAPPTVARSIIGGAWWPVPPGPALTRVEVRPCHLASARPRLSFTTLPSLIPNGRP